MIIAIDGPAGSGKSTVAKRVARALGFHYLDTGAMYRAVAYRVVSQGCAPDDEAAAVRVVTTEEIGFGHEPGEPLPSRVFIGGEDVSEAIRAPEVDDAVSAVARMRHVREAMVAQQRHLAQTSDIVVEGRDIGTVVFPDAALKVYLTASPEERARRRAAQQVASGLSVDEDEVRAALLRRDAADESRDHSPLSAARDAVRLDTTGMTLDEVVNAVAALAEERGA